MNALAVLVALWAVSAPGDVVVARWQGGELRLDAFLRRLALERWKTEVRRGAPLPDEGRARAALAAAVLEGVVNQELLVREARRRGIRATRREVSRALRGFLRAARVRPALLRARLRQAGLDLRALRASLRAEALAHKVLAAEKRRLRVTRADLAQARAEAQWRGEGHLPDTTLRARILARKLSERTETLLDELRRREAVTIYLKAEDALGAAERRATEERALAFYRERNPSAPAGITAEVVPMGCHTEIAIKLGSVTLARLGHAGGRIFELGRK